jgi:outer membrane immunogenic protein
MKSAWGLVVVAGIAVAASSAQAGGQYGGSFKDEPIVVLPQYNWSGLYIGAHVGGAWSDIERHYPLADHYVNTPGAVISHEADGAVAGGHLGLQHQVGHVVIGGEVNLTHADLDAHSTANSSSVGNNPVDLNTEIRSIFTATARLGYAWDRWLVYAKGGYANAKFEVSSEDPSDTASSTHRHNGWVVGGGLEYALLRDVIIGVEYNYMNFDERTHFADCRPGCASPTFQDTDVDAEVQTVMARLTLKLGRDQAPPPVPLK